jgi:hypothetical protein
MTRDEKMSLLREEIAALTSRVAKQTLDLEVLQSWLRNKRRHLKELEVDDAVRFPMIQRTGR